MHIKADPEYNQPKTAQGDPGERVLVEYQIDHTGKVSNAKIVASDALPAFQARALELVKSMEYDVTTAGFDPNDSTPLRYTIEFCLPVCQVPPYLGTTGLRIATQPTLQNLKPH